VALVMVVCSDCYKGSNPKQVLRSLTSALLIESTEIYAAIP
jgi:hypothetical protein